MSDVFTVDRSVDQDAKRIPNVVDVGAWLNNAKAIRRDLADYIPRHRAPGLAV
jgi:hypothetical protein